MAREWYSIASVRYEIEIDDDQCSSQSPTKRIKYCSGAISISRLSDYEI